MNDEHGYRATLTWTGDRGTGTSGYRDYARDVEARIDGKPLLLGSADAPFRGDPSRWNPEDLLLTSLSQCHLLSYLHAAVTAGFTVVSYTDDAVGTMRVVGNGGRFEEVVLHPRVTIREADRVDDALAAHDTAHEWCFIANSVSFPVRHEAIIDVAP